MKNKKASFITYLVIVQTLILAHGFMIIPSSLPKLVTTHLNPNFRKESNLLICRQQSPSSEDGPLKSSTAPLLATLLARFQGDFDNFNQVCSDRSNDLLPRQGGGHEHFHVTLIPLPINILPDSRDLFPVEEENKNESCCGAVVAAYYFDGMPNRIFRLRMYTLYCDSECRQTGDRVKMKLFTFDPSLEGKLREKSSSSVESWIDLIREHVSSETMGDDSVKSSLCVKEMGRCDILWTEQPDLVRHAYLNEYTRASREEMHQNHPIHAIMVNDHEKGGVLLESQMMPGSYIRVQDELSLWGDELWINDRGHDADSKNMVYGNWKGVPYQMTRVSNIVVASEASSKLTRNIVDPTLRWTLGDEWRTPKEYESKMSLIGGVSTRMNKKEDIQSVSSKE
mmetsp:Transcript_12137/g.18628  ORF Transcript_12137/g.18628 Transcript_12137/m.18628 type:complete len:396 (-) Transcript_12137:242-1429(-)